MEIQQHDGVVVEVAASRQGFAKLLREGEVLQGEREAPGAVVLLPCLPPPLYIGPLGGAPHLPWGASLPPGRRPPSRWVLAGAPPPRGPI